MDQVAAIYETAVFAVDQIPGDLLHPEPLRRRGDRGDRAPMGRQEGLPGNRTTPNWIDSVLSWHAFDHVSADLVSEIHQGSAKARAPPTRILERHPNDEALDFSIDSRTSGPSLRAPVVLRRDQLAVPAEQPASRTTRDCSGNGVVERR